MAFVATRQSGFDIILKKGFQVKPGSTFICGFHGLGEVGFLSTAHLTRTLEAKRVGFIKSDMLPLFVSMENNRLVLPFELYSYPKKKLIFLVPRFQPHQSDQWNFVDRLAEWLAKCKFSETILLGGLDASFKEDEANMRCVPTSKYEPPRAAAAMLEKMNQVYGLKANVEQLLEESKEIERLEKMRRSIESDDRTSDMFV
jgi:uncharacterized protein